MNKEQFAIIQMLEASSNDKAAFLRRILDGASKGFDRCVARDAQRLHGELALRSSIESHGTYYGKKNVGTCTESGGDLHTSISHKFRERKTLKDFDWSNFGTAK